MEQLSEPRTPSLPEPSSEKQSPHSPANALSVVEDVELVHKLVHCVARFGDGAEVGHEPHVIALLGGEQKEPVPQGSLVLANDTEFHLLPVRWCKPHLPIKGVNTHIIKVCLELVSAENWKTVT